MRMLMEKRAAGISSFADPAMEKRIMEKRIEAFAGLGRYMACAGSDPEFEAVIRKARGVNPFFERENILRALSAWAGNLEAGKLAAWISPYREYLPKRLDIAVVMAGNIPVVGFHDYLCVLLSGNSFQGKLSSKDPFLLPFLHAKLRQMAPAGSGLGEDSPDPARFTEGKVEDFSAIIATGSGNTFRYFEHYFGKYPHLLRKNRTSCAVLDGKESVSDLEGLCDDILSYFGLGCRNVSKLYVPEAYDFAALSRLLAERGARLMENAPYRDNYDYRKSLFIVNRTPFIDTGSCLLAESRSMASPMAAIYYQYYRDAGSLQEELRMRAEELQCRVGKGGVPFGRAQSPALADYADGVDTLAFLCSLACPAPAGTFSGESGGERRGEPGRGSCPEAENGEGKGETSDEAGGKS